ncbi:ABC transporter substrate-binding protein [Actinoplanes sp. SE50]|uniref:metal ABC transporter substrate-binding protein n=1 Tax=unclassified Actinoplanes TaxID=2626549 RepID=UPI00023EBCC5|nr:MULTISPECIES: metal ABC transporter substrate-binding protein [unclassified Actinoplanes]AEV82334.1 Metal ABC transporter substrate-binding lipoprotein [Actinoplanes sp. SE50/110]ATO80731.1 ABC transporter substrate-binding protein [Actinoplanes sp. SE50]SLL98139.1 ABC transporter substrate-binding protein [Actinoplanes sp. SE50/110]
MMRRLLTPLLLLAVLAGCGARAAADGRMPIVAAFYPLQFVSERIGGDLVRVVNLTKPGAEPHDVELSPRQVAQIVDAKVAVHVAGFQPAVDEAIEQNAAIAGYDVSAAAAPEHHDPHVWLDPVRLAAIADRLAVRFGQADPPHAATYTANAAALHRQLDDLDAEFRTRLASCPRRELVTSHTAFHYLAERYHLTQIGITGVDPEAEPSPRRLAEVAADARAHGTTTIFFETLVSPKVADTIAREVGAKTAVLDPLEGLIDPSADYFSVMRANLASLTTALGCPS